MPLANHYLWNQNHIRFYLAQTNGKENFNWLFVPGGPGADSSYFLSLVNKLDLPGNVWLIDLPNSGSNQIESSSNYDFDQWYQYFIPFISNFTNPIYVGHSFGGMLPLCFPQLEDILKGFVILNSAPTLWLEEAANVAVKKNIPILSEPLQEFETNPNPETFQEALLACLPYYFPPHSLKEGKALLENLPFNYHAAQWWLKKANEINFNAEWIPQAVPTLIIGGSEDSICPPTLFQNDKRFHRENITIKIIENAGHMPWVENFAAVTSIFHSFITVHLNS